VFNSINLHEHGKEAEKRQDDGGFTQRKKYLQSSALRQCKNSRIFLRLRFCVKSILGNSEYKELFLILSKPLKHFLIFLEIEVTGKKVARNYLISHTVSAKTFCSGIYRRILWGFLKRITTKFCTKHRKYNGEKRS